MQIETIPFSEVVPYEKNPRKNDKAVDIVMKSIKEFGFKVPIIIDKNNVIISGHTRLKAAQKMGLTEVPIIWADDLSEEQIKQFRIMDNKSHEYSTWNWGFLKDEILALKKAEADLSLTGFNETELSMILGIEDEGLDTGDPPKYDIKTGDIWQCGPHKIMCGDSRDPEIYGQLLKEEKITLAFTSPPYNMNAGLYKNKKGGGTSYKDNLPSKEYIAMNLKVVKNVEPHLEGYIFWNLSYNKNSRWEFIEIFHEIITNTGLMFLENIIWDKGTGLPITSPQMLTRSYENILVVGVEEIIQKELSYNLLAANIDKIYIRKKGFKALTNYWRIPVRDTQKEINKAAFPIELPTKAILLMTDKNDLIFDPFLGTGTTLFAAHKTGRKFYGIELDNAYCSYIIEKLEKMTGNQAKQLKN